MPTCTPALPSLILVALIALTAAAQEPEPIEPSGTWTVYQGDSRAPSWTLIVEKDRQGWKTWWIGADGSQYRGSMQYSNGRWVEFWRAVAYPESPASTIEWVWAQRGGTAPAHQYRAE